MSCSDPCSKEHRVAAPKIRSGARAGGRLFPGPRGSPAASSAAGPRAAISCARACGRGGWLPPSLGFSSRRTSRNGRGASRKTPSRCSVVGSAGARGIGIGDRGRASPGPKKISRSLRRPNLPSLRRPLQSPRLRRQLPHALRLRRRPPHALRSEDRRWRQADGMR